MSSSIIWRSWSCLKTSNSSKYDNAVGRSNQFPHSNYPHHPVHLRCPHSSWAQAAAPRQEGPNSTPRTSSMSASHVASKDCMNRSNCLSNSDRKSAASCHTSLWRQSRHHRWSGAGRVVSILTFFLPMPRDVPWRLHNNHNARISMDSEKSMVNADELNI